LEEAEKIADRWTNTPQLRKRLTDQIALALASRAQKATEDERERIKKHLKSLDPLLAIADWENSEDIAYAVQSFIVDNIRKAAK
jgi:hypothetical protein